MTNQRITADLWEPLTDNQRKVVQAYLTCALWSSTDDDSEPLSSVHTVDDIARDAIKQAIEDCLDFLSNNHIPSHVEPSKIGHDFWLTRNGHGAGFWDRPEIYGSQRIANKLSEASKVYGSCDPYIGDDGLLYFL